MGASGAGKSTVADGLATRMGWTSAEGDAFHSEANVRKMRSGEPLTDEDRWPWLAAIGSWISSETSKGRSAVVTCSALRRSYRDALRSGRPQVRFCHLLAGRELLTERLDRRNGHYIPATLLPSQLATLEPLEPDELATGSVVVSAEGVVSDVIDRAMAALELAAPSRAAEGQRRR